jgi:hypothetical protein
LEVISVHPLCSLPEIDRLAPPLGAEHGRARRRSRSRRWWLLADKAAGIDIHQPAFGSAAPQPLSVAFATLVAALAAVLGWALLALLERRSPRAARLWFRIAVATMLVSLAGPLAGHGISAGNRLALFCMHLAAATIIIALLYRTTTPLDAQAKRKHPR